MKPIHKIVLSTATVAAIAIWVGLAMPSRTQGAPQSVPPPTASESPPPTTNHVPITDLGIQTSGLTDAQVTTLLNDTQAAGATVISTAAAWTSMQPTQLSAINFTSLDSLVTQVRARGMKVRLQLETLPVFARDSLLSTDYWTPPLSAAERSRWDTFVQAVVAHFKGKVTYYEVWNEPNLSEFWPTGPDPTAFANLLQTSYVTIKAADPAAKVISGGLSRNDLGFETGVYKALDSAFGSAAKTNHHYSDYLGIHPYSGDRSPSVVDPKWVYQTSFGLMDENYTGFTRLHDLLKSYGEGSKGLYIGEFGYSTVAGNGFQAVPDNQRATFLTSAFTIASHYTYITALSWYYTHTTSASNTAPWALINADGSLTQTYAALVAHAKAVGQVK